MRERPAFVRVRALGVFERWAAVPEDPCSDARLVVVLGDPMPPVDVTLHVRGLRGPATLTVRHLSMVALAFDEAEVAMDLDDTGRLRSTLVPGRYYGTLDSPWLGTACVHFDVGPEGGDVFIEVTD